jgi:hypothetical protein
VKRFRRAFVLSAFLLIPACSSEQIRLTDEPPLSVVAWKHLATWSGRASIQTETFLSDTGVFRINWEAKNESAPGKGTLRVAFRSGDSGRVIIDAVNQKGVGKSSAEVGDMVRWYYLSIDAADVDWSVTVEEPIMGRTVGRTDP